MSEALEVEITFHIEAPETPNSEVTHLVTLKGFPPYQKGDVIHVKLVSGSDIKPFEVALIEHFLYPNADTNGVDKIGMIVHLKEVTKKSANWRVA